MSQIHFNSVYKVYVLLFSVQSTNRRERSTARKPRFIRIFWCYFEAKRGNRATFFRFPSAGIVELSPSCPSKSSFLISDQSHPIRPSYHVRVITSVRVIQVIPSVPVIMHVRVVTSVRVIQACFIRIIPVASCPNWRGIYAYFTN